MKHILAFVLLSVLAWNAFAQSTTEMNPVRIVAPRADQLKPTLHPDDLRPYRGYYTLSNGMDLGITAFGRRMYAQMSNQPVHEIVATGLDRFVSLDGMMEMQIVLGEHNTASGFVRYVDERYGDDAVARWAARWTEVSLR